MCHSFHTTIRTCLSPYAVARRHTPASLAPVPPRTSTAPSLCGEATVRRSMYISTLSSCRPIVTPISAKEANTETKKRSTGLFQIEVILVRSRGIDRRGKCACALKLGLSKMEPPRITELSNELTRQIDAADPLVRLHNTWL